MIRSFSAPITADIAAGRAGSHPESFTAAGDRLYFTADDGVIGRELWSLKLKS